MFCIALIEIAQRRTYIYNDFGCLRIIGRPPDGKFYTYTSAHWPNKYGYQNNLSCLEFLVYSQLHCWPDDLELLHIFQQTGVRSYICAMSYFYQ